MLSKKSFFPGGQVACTQEAKLCPDGTAVGRTGPNCEFAECPKATSTQGAFCGGIATGAFPCPDGYTCKLDGSFPDAGGHCIKSPVSSGILAGKVSSTPPVQRSNISTANWLAYINTKYIFGFRYPEGKVPYIAVDKENKILLPAGANAERIVLAEDEAQIFNGIPKTLAFDVIKEDISNENWLAGNLQKYISSGGFVSQKNIQFHGKGAVEVIGSGTGGSAYKLILVKPGNFSIAIVESAKSEFLDSVLQTFTFDVQSLK